MVAVINPIAVTLLKLVILFLLMGIVCLIMNKTYQNKQEKRADRLQREYKVLTPSLLASVKDEELLDVIIANLNAKQDAQNPDPYYSIPLLSPGRFEMYAVWVIHHELNNGNIPELLASRSASFCEPAIEGFEHIGAPLCAKAIREAIADDATEDTLADCHIAFIEAEANEKPLELCVPYIREHAEEFIDVADETEENTK